MEYIDILWNQDVDMGVPRELYDPAYIDKQQKQMEMKKNRIDEIRKEIAKHESMYYTIDEETGERIPISTENPEPPAFVSQISVKDSLKQDLDDISSLINLDDTELEKYLTSSVLNDELQEDQFQSIIQQHVPHPPPVQQPDQGSWLDVDVDIFGPVSYNTQTSPAYDEFAGILNATPLYIEQAPASTDLQNQIVPCFDLGDYTSSCAEQTVLSTQADCKPDKSFLNSQFDMFPQDEEYDPPLPAYSNDDDLEDFKPFIFSSNKTPATYDHSLSYNFSSGGNNSTGTSQPSTPYSNSAQSEHTNDDDFNDQHSNSGSSKSGRNFCRDEMRVKELEIPYSVDTLTNCPVEEFNSILHQNDFTEEQLNLIKDIRRRGKNKVAAQNCRKKKICELTELEDEIHDLKRRKTSLMRDKAVMLKNMRELEAQMNQTYAEVFNSIVDPTGKPYDPRFYQMRLTEGGEAKMVPISLNLAAAATSAYHNIPDSSAAYSLLDLSMKG